VSVPAAKLCRTYGAGSVAIGTTGEEGRGEPKVKITSLRAAGIGATASRGMESHPAAEWGE